MVSVRCWRSFHQMISRSLSRARAKKSPPNTEDAHVIPLSAVSLKGKPASAVESKPKPDPELTAASKPKAGAKKTKGEVASDAVCKSEMMDNGVPNYWLFKSEPNSRIEHGIDMKFSIDDLEASANMTSTWDGVRNYQARNLMRDQMKIGDLGFFYHSSCPEPGIVGIVTVTKEGYPDHTSWDRSSGHYDAKSTSENPRWFMVDVTLVRRLKRLISLKKLKALSADLNGMALVAPGSRLSVQPVGAEHWNYILGLEEQRS